MKSTTRIVLVLFVLSIVGAEFVPARSVDERAEKRPALPIQNGLSTDSLLTAFSHDGVAGSVPQRRKRRRRARQRRRAEAIPVIPQSKEIPMVHPLPPSTPPPVLPIVEPMPAPVPQEAPVGGAPPPESSPNSDGPGRGSQPTKSAPKIKPPTVQIKPPTE